ncbi:MAG: GNAT family N-acetyltransferase [Paenibacillus sp.]|uniref:GNAT family N-acetyltransferase n=1 Tax=Paenibacillus sp. TaxID=58172 RepID=UPI00290998B0|nr:GNAT family N-acetyltransferase [Paenibacillus sp.]MDU4696557.1 GNAT family N-acetyltransferase [Paenibacillus sp.]
MKTLETDRLLLREWRESDASGYFDLFKSPDVTNAGARVCESVEEGREAVRAFIQSQESWAIVLQENDQLIGCITLEDIHRHDRYKELEYVIAAEAQNQGYATEAVQRVLRYAFTELKLYIVAVCHYPDNLKSKRVIEKCGFTYEGTLRGYSRNLKDSVRYSMTREEWESRQR